LLLKRGQIMMNLKGLVLWTLLLLPILASDESSNDDGILFGFSQNSEAFDCNTVGGLIELCESKCDENVVNFQNLYTILDPYFEFVSGISITVGPNSEKENCSIFDIEISLLPSPHFGEAMDDSMLENDFAKLKSYIADKIPCEHSSIEFKNFKKFVSEVPESRIPAAKQMTTYDIIQTKNGRRFLQNVPSSIDHRSKIGGIRNQGGMGSCVAFSFDTLLQFYEYKSNGESQKFSPKFTYYHRCTVLPWRGNPCPAGMYGYEVDDIVNKYGAVLEKEFPYKSYSEKHNEKNIPSNVKAWGRERALNVYSFATQEYKCMHNHQYGDFQDFKMAIKTVLSRGPAYFASTVYYPLNRCDIWNYRSGDKGAHAMSFTGYDEGCLTVRNSWGQGWCKRGYATMTWKEAHTRTTAICWFNQIDDCGSGKAGSGGCKCAANVLCSKNEYCHKLTESCHSYPNSCKRVIIEAEDAKKARNFPVNREHKGYLGRGIRDHKGDSSFLEFEVILNNPGLGSGEIEIRYANADRKDRYLKLKVNEHEEKEVVFQSGLRSWRDYRTVSVPVWSLRPGRNIIQLKACKGKRGPNVDRLTIHNCVKKSTKASQGNCRGGSLKWEDGKMWDCTPGQQTRLGCEEKCKKTRGCAAFDITLSPFCPTDAKGSCCLFKGGYTGNDSKHRWCYNLNRGDVAVGSVMEYNEGDDAVGSNMNTNLENNNAPSVSTSFIVIVLGIIMCTFLLNKFIQMRREKNLKNSPYTSLMEEEI
jgi:C1A family cysteine protease